MLATAPSNLPSGMQALLNGLGIDANAFASALVGAKGDWLIVETAQPLLSTDTNASSDVYRLNLISNQLTLISAAAHGQAGNGPSGYAAADASGELIIFQSDADDLVAHDNNGVTDLFLHDLGVGQNIRLTAATQASAHAALDASGLTLVYDQRIADGSRQVLGQAILGNEAPELLSLLQTKLGTRLDNHHPAISSDGRFIAYLEEAVWGLAADADETRRCQVHLYDRATQVYHRQPCPAPLADAHEIARPVFTADGTQLLWYLPAQADPIALANPLSDVY
jgi:hypothetical protein